MKEAVEKISDLEATNELVTTTITQFAARSTLLPGGGRRDYVLRLRVAVHRQLSGLCDNRLEGGRWLHVLDDRCWYFHDRQLVAPSTSRQGPLQTHCRGPGEERATCTWQMWRPVISKDWFLCHLVRLFLFLRNIVVLPDCEVFSICLIARRRGRLLVHKEPTLCVQDVGHSEHVRELFFTVWQQNASILPADADRLRC